MLGNEEILARLKFDSDINIKNASKWSDEDLLEMKLNYEKALKIANDSHNRKLMQIMEEKIRQLKEAILLKKRAHKDSSIVSEVNL